MAQPKILPSGPDRGARGSSSLFHSSPSDGRASTRNLPSFPELSSGSLSSRRFPRVRPWNQRDTRRCWSPVRPISLLRPPAGQDAIPHPRNGKRTPSCAPILCLCVCVCVSEWTVSLNYFLPVRPLISPFYFIPTKTKGRISEIYWNWAWAHFLKRKIKLAVLTLTFLRYLSIFKKMERFFFIFIVANYIWNFLKASSQGNSLVEFVCPKYNLYLSSVHRK